MDFNHFNFAVFCLIVQTKSAQCNCVRNSLNARIDSIHEQKQHFFALDHFQNVWGLIHEKREDQKYLVETTKRFHIVQIQFNGLKNP